jgi:CRP/FNR family cyclic AMP-dependent transcriptional regulator
MIELDWVNVAGYSASLLVFSAFYMKAMAPLRTIAIASNVAFIAYGLGAGLYPVLVLHAVLLPLNCLRLLQTRGLVRRVRAGLQGSFGLEWLIPMMTCHTFRSGDVLFKIGDPARSTSVILSGSVRVAEIGVVLGPGSLIGEIGVFAPDGCRTGTALCETDVEIGSISDQRLLQLCVQDPTFGLMRLVVQRLLDNERRRVAKTECDARPT